MQELFAALREEMPSLPFGQNKAPLGSSDEFRAEMSGAGFRDIEVHEVGYDLETASVDELWAHATRTMAPLVLLRKKLGDEAWSTMSRGTLARLRARAQPGPQRATMLANLGVGVV
jgi:hypothetical protein